MTDILILILKVVLIVMFAVFIGRKTGLFALGRGICTGILVLLLFLCGASIYETFFCPDIVLQIVFRSSFFNLTLDLSFFLTVFLFTLFLGMVCTVSGVQFSMKINSVRDLCTLAMLIAITVLLAVYATIRVGSAIKIPFKFIPVFITAALFGPMWGGTVGVIADIVAFVLNPVGGSLIPQITLIEFFYGFVYGLFFYNLTSWGGFKTMFRIIICVILQILIFNLGLTTYMLMPLMQMEFEPLLIMRAPAGVINMALQLIVLSVLSRYISGFRKIIK